MEHVQPISRPECDVDRCIVLGVYLFDSRDSLMRMLGRRAHNYAGYHPGRYDLTRLSSFSPCTVDVRGALVPSAFSHAVQSFACAQTPVIRCTSSCRDPYKETLNPDRGITRFLAKYFFTLRYCNAKNYSNRRSTFRTKLGATTKEERVKNMYIAC